MKPFSEACERNRGAILSELKRVFSDRKAVLEIGSGTGQHAACFAPELPRLTWQPSDVAYSANTCHIMSWPQGGRHTSESNSRFDAMLRSRDPASGLRDFEAILALAGISGLAHEEDNTMPANNRLLVFRRR